eukprot:TRINITY_DN11819_c4_g1_i5.p1 TRINITY_DN11819_c4_g1~~TRINITY_DN11819_c4_g1_i5.p1  ORF type:complete len:1165 (+),score=413.54 TRINITY_DN11819_c4_g1_i5:208-3702(+)
MADLNATHDLASSESLDEAKLSGALEMRYQKDVIYTYVGDILVAVNPYKTLPLYTDAVARSYMNLAGKALQPPHLYAIADAAYNQMARNRQPQVSVISGESGAGKTESTKHFIRQIMMVSSKAAGADDGAERTVHPIERQILAINPVLEAFGNAQTVMNDNSSRFGKFIELKFNSFGSVFGASLSHYLLEKARVVKQGPGERNYHIFELLLEGAKDRLGGLHLAGHDEFKYLANRDEDKARLKQEWDEVQAAFPGIGFEAEDTQNIERVLAAVLLFGQLEFKEGGNGEDAAVVNQSVLDGIAQLLGVSPQAASEGFMTTKITVGSETIYKPLNVQKTHDSRDAVAKAVYDRLFIWLVTKIDIMLCPDEARSEETSTIGILDIFGFEDFKSNGFDQMCINLANEQLHQFFNTHIFASEIEEYAAEGVDGAQVLFSDNKLVLDLYYGKPGLFSVLDEETNFPSATDKTLMEKFTAQLKEAEAFEMNKGGYAFKILHYAGPITYQGEGLLDKNKDPLPNRMADSMREAENLLARLLFRPNFVEITRGNVDGPAENIKRKKSKRGKASKKINTVSAGFKQSLVQLMVRMNRCKPHFVRCIKPNLDKKPGVFVSEQVMKQLKYTGMLQTIEIRKDGYPNRPNFREFIETYKGAVFDFTAKMDWHAANCRKILEKAEAKQKEIAQAQGMKGKTSELSKWIVARTKVFLKYWHSDILDNMMRPMDQAAITIQKWVRRFTAQAKFYEIVYHYREQMAASANFFKDIQGTGRQLHAGLQALVDEEKRRGPEGLGIIKKMTSKEEAKAKKALAKEVKQAVSTDAKANEKNAKKMQAALNKKQAAAVKWWTKFEQRHNNHMDEKGELYPWFHGLISRRDAENYIFDEEPGTFLVRVSEKANGYALSFKFGDRPRHYKIEVALGGGYTVMGSKERFADLKELIDFYHTHDLSDDHDRISDPLLLDHDLNLGIGSSNTKGVRKKPRQSYESFTPRGMAGGSSSSDPLTKSEYIRSADGKKPAWLRGKMDRGECEAELRDQGMVDGRFLVRLKQEKNDAVVYALSYTADEEFYHHLLTRKKNQQWTLNDRPLRVDFIEDCIEKFQDREYPGLACRLQASYGGGGLSRMGKRASMHMRGRPSQYAIQAAKGGKAAKKKKGKKPKRSSQAPLPGRFKLDS